MFDFLKRLADARAAQKRQHIGNSQLQTFILEQILTPSGFVDSGDDLFDADIPLPEIDDSLSEFEPLEDDALRPDNALPDSTLPDSTLPDNALPDTSLEESNFQPIPFVDTAEPVLDSEPQAAAAQLEPYFEAGVFTVGDSGQVSIDYLFDGGGYKGELALFTLEGMDGFDLNDADSVQDFIQEAAHRALQNDADSGYVAISDRTEGARFSGQLGEGRDWNAGNYQGIQTFELNPGDEFALMLVPHSTVERVYNLLLNDQSLSSREQPLFSLATINPDDSFQLGQIASIVEGGNTFVMEDILIAGGSDGDYNDLIFQIQGAAADDIPTLDELPSFAQDWRDSDTGQALLSYTNFEDAEITIAEHLPDSVRYAIERAIDLDSHDPEALAATQQWVVGVSSRPLSPDVLHLLQAENLGATGHIPNTFLWEFAADLSPQQVHQRLDDLSGIEFAYPLVAQQHELRMPTLADQWHLAEISPIWDNFSDEGITGAGVTIGIVDDGLGYEHPNIRDNYRLDLSRDFHDPEDGIYGADPWPKSEQKSDGSLNWDSHGTSMAAIAAGHQNNGTGISGVAPNASVVGLRLFESGRVTAPVTSTDLKEADSLSYLADDVDVYSNSWGPNDRRRVRAQGPKPSGPAPLATMALHTGVTQGREGRGSIFVWAAGNAQKIKDFRKRIYRDRVDYDGYASSRYTIAVAAIAPSDDEDQQEYKQTDYSEPGASLLISAPSSRLWTSAKDDPNDRKIVTALLNGPRDGNWDDDYTYTSGGTSAAAAFVSGVVALMLEANPNLTWREVQHILVETARQNDPDDPGDPDDLDNNGWTTNAAGYPINYKYGFGAVDADAAVNAAKYGLDAFHESVKTGAAIDTTKTWQPIGAEISLTSGRLPLGEVDDQGVPQGIPIPAGPAVLKRTVTIDERIGENITVESVEVMFDATHADRGDLKVVLISPDDTESILAQPHTLPPDDSDEALSNADYKKWVFTSMRHWGESSHGTWRLEVSDEDGNAIDGTWNQWQLNLYGAYPIVTIEASDAHAREGSSDVGTMTIRRTGNLKQPLTVHATLDVDNRSWRPNATEGKDYRYRGNAGVTSQDNQLSMTIPAGEESVTVAVEALEDSDVEWPESVKWQLQPGEDYEINNHSFAEVHLWDNEPPLVHLYTEPFSTQAGITYETGYISEAGNEGYLRIRRLGDLSQPLSVYLSTETLEGDVTAADYEVAIEGAGYAPMPYPIDFPAVAPHAEWFQLDGQDLFLKLKAVQDEEAEGTERFKISIDESPNGSYTIRENAGSREIVIGDDDAHPSVTFEAAKVPIVEGENATITVQRQGDTTNELQVKYWMSNTLPLATPNVDYMLPDSLENISDVLVGTLEIAAGDSSASFEIQSWDDNHSESTEHVRLVLQAGENYSIGAKQVVLVQIEDNDIPGATSTQEQYVNPPNSSETYYAAQSITIDSKGQIYIAGRTGDVATSDDVNIGDAFVAQFVVQSDDTLQLGKNWPKQIGTSGFDEARGVAVDGEGNLYVTGWTDGNPDGKTAGREAWIAKYNSEGAIWDDGLVELSQAGNSEANYDISNGSMTVDKDGNVYIVGYTLGNLGEDSLGETVENKGQADAWVAKYRNDGTSAWIRQLGSSEWDEAQSVAVDRAGNVYVTGHTQGQLRGTQVGDADIWVAKYDREGTEQWVKQFGTESWEESRGIAVDDQGHVYLGGQTNGRLGEIYPGKYQDWVGDLDAFQKARYGDRSGFGGVYRGKGDAWVAQVNGEDGTVNWKRLLGTAATDGAMDVAADGDGNVYLTGFTRGELVPDAQAGGSDVFAAKYNVDGALQWRRQLGSDSGGDEVANGIALYTDPVTQKVNVYLTGVTDGDFAGASAAGGEDAWVVQLE